MADSAGQMEAYEIAEGYVRQVEAERDRYRAALHKITVDGGSLGDIAREALNPSQPSQQEEPS